MSEVNIDAGIIRDGGANLSHTEETLVEMSNGCICRTLRDDLLQQVTRLAAEGRFEYLFIESTCIFEPLPVAATFEFRDELGVCLSDMARLDTMVTVVDNAMRIRSVRSTTLTHRWRCPPEPRSPVPPNHGLCRVGEINLSWLL